MLIKSDLAKRLWQWGGYRLAQAAIPRMGELAEVRRSCCTQYSGLLVKVIGLPHHVANWCPTCGTKLAEYFVEVEPQKREAELFKQYNGPFYMPVSWLKRVVQ